MQTIQQHDDSLKTQHRPNLSINTSFNKKKKGWHQLLTHKSDAPAHAKPSKQNSLPTLSSSSSVPQLQHHHSTFVGLASLLQRKASSPTITGSSTSSSVENLTDDSSSPFKKFHLPFHKRNNSQGNASSTTAAASIAMTAHKQEEHYTPTAPERIMPSLVNWSPEAPVSPPPWELNDAKPLFNRKKRHSLSNHNFYDDFRRPSSTSSRSIPVEDYHSDSEAISTNIKPLQSNSPSDSIDRNSDVTLVGLTSIPSTSSTDNNSAGSPPTLRVRRRSSCPTYDTLSLSSDSTLSSKTLIENDIISITEQHTRHMSVLKKYTHPVDKKPAFKTCQKAKARAAEAAVNGEVVQTNPLYSSFCEDSLKYLYIPNVFDPVTREPILEFAIVKPRKYQLHRKTSWKREAKALMTWHHALEEQIQRPPAISSGFLRELSSDKLERYQLTRRFILREFFTTEVNFWNQLYYTKIVFYDALVYSLNKESTFAKAEDADIFANLFDLMQFSAKLINRLRHFQLNYVNKVVSTTPNPPADHADTCSNVDCNNLQLGSILVDMAEDLVVFLRCALDYKGNRKHLDNTEHREGYVKYRQRLQTRKETSQFSMQDYLIIPVQRVARYGLLLADLLKHTQPNHPDYNNLIKAHQIVTSLASAMNSVQKKKKKT
ncbi:Dbl homology domain-containing protein [Parasitella parasitica]|nr:Dbl homology domain-containing protein [Parasitella parasitica]